MFLVVTIKRPNIRKPYFLLTLSRKIVQLMAYLRCESLIVICYIIEITINKSHLFIMGYSILLYKQIHNNKPHKSMSIWSYPCHSNRYFLIALLLMYQQYGHINIKENQSFFSDLERFCSNLFKPWKDR